MKNISRPFAVFIKPFPPVHIWPYGKLKLAYVGRQSEDCRTSGALQSYNVSMPKKQSAGLLLYRRSSGNLEVLLVHPGGPFWKNKDEGAWTIPKGEFDENEDPLIAAKREFEEETGTTAPTGEYKTLQPIKQRAGKIVHAWAVEAEFDVASLRSNTFSIEWPPRSGKQQDFPEIDRAEWMEPEVAREKILQAQVGLVDEVVSIVGLKDA